MPTIKKHVKRPWVPEREPFGGRVHPNHDFYTSRAWKRLRVVVLREHPFCVECLKQKRYTPATVVDHIVPINQGGAPLDEANLQPLCSSCHNKKSATER